MIQDAERCTKTVYRSNWARPGRCTKRGTVERGGQLFCTQHDPERQHAKDEQEKLNRKQIEHAAEQLRIEADGISELLGVAATVYRAWNWRDKETKTHRYVVISFEDAHKLIERLKS